MRRCDCDLRDRQWNGYGRCLHCGQRYDEYGPRATARDLDPTTAAIVAEATERSHLRAEVTRLSAIAATIGSAGDAEWLKGYDQAVAEIEDHFEKSGRTDLAAEVAKVFGKGSAA